MRSRTVAGFALVFALTAGCDGGAPAPATPDAEGRAAMTALARSDDHLQSESFTVEVTSGDAMRTTSRMDVPNRRAETALRQATGEDQSLTVRTRLLGDAVFMHLDGVSIPGVDDRWMRIDPARIARGREVGFAPGQNDAGGADRVLAAITEASRLPDGRYKGTLDLAQVGTGTGLSFSTTDIAGLGDAARAVPFLATLDERGRLVHLQIDLPSITAGKAPMVETRYSAFGEPFTVETPPAAQTVTPPDSVYQYFGG
ncbi:hypothetical protein [Catenuloplanes atrovinosus]|uniref:Lipoprotein n=1 Tax=Catenuloplanes atrovinosus TaxID=137266 RepID=A0AAE3YU82_9ACTN|nr:hypothetical protein [Catenuloplanes atrovinosus]MDR7278499.1 hypothetical protein [Catenuloplanes atrovinosus]